MKKLFAIGLTVCLSATMGTLAASAQPDLQTRLHGNTAYMWVKVAPAIYYKVYGKYPPNWNAVRASGLVQVTLLTSDDRSVDPDDGKLDFMGDVVYIYQGEQKPPMLGMMTGRDGATVRREQTNSSTASYAQTFDSLARLGKQIPSTWKSEQTARLLGLAACMNYALISYYSVADRKSLHSMEELLACRISPVSINSVNPITGALLTGPTDSHSLRFIWNPAAGEQEALAVVKVTDSNARLIDVLSF